MEDQQQMIEGVQTELTRSLSDAANAVEIITRDTMITRLGNKYELTEQEVFDLVGIIDVLSTPVEQQSVFESSFCYLFRNHFLVSDISTYHAPLLNIYTDTLGIDQKDFFSILDDNRVLGTVRLIEGKNGDGYLMVLRNIYDSRYKEKLACVGVMLRLDKLFASWNDGEAEIFLTDEKGMLLYGSEKAQEICNRKMPGKIENETIQLSGEKYLYSFYPSEQGIQYGFLTAEKSYYQGVRMAKLSLAVQVILFFALGIGLAVFLSKKTWSPIEGVLLFMNRSSAQDEKAEYQTLEGFADALKNVMQERETLENRLMQAQERVNNGYIARYLTGSSEDPSLLSQYIEEGQHYRLILFKPLQPEKSEYFSGIGQDRYTETMEALLFAVHNILEETLLVSRGGVCLEIEDSVIMLAEEPLTEEEIGKADEAVKNALRISVTSYVSGVCLSLSDAPGAWERVHEACVSDAFWQNEPRMGVYLIGDQLQSTDYKSYDAFLEQQQKLAGFLSAKKYSKARKCLEEILDGLLIKPELSPEVVRYRYWGTAEILVSCLPEGERIPNCSTVWEMQKELVSLFDRIIEEKDEPAAENKNALWAGEIREYIQKTYQDPALNASMIAEHFGLTLSTLSRRYKNATGHGVLDELHMIRLEAAKKLLEEGMSVTETAEKTGYVESRAMIRAFKRYEGITPGQYAGR